MIINVPKTGVRLPEDRANALWQVILQFQFPFAEGYLHYKHKWNESFSTTALAEYRKFAFLALLSDREITPSEAVDEVWHIHILHTDSYAKFAEVCGRFLHHWPGMPAQQKKWNNQYLNTHRLYEAVFGARPPYTHWPLHAAPERNASIGEVLVLFDRRLQQQIAL